MVPSDEYKIALEQVNKFAERRQAIATIYLSVNAALTTAIAFLFKDGSLTDVVSQFSAPALLFSGGCCHGTWWIIPVASANPVLADFFRHWAVRKGHLTLA